MRPAAAGTPVRPQRQWRTRRFAGLSQRRRLPHRRTSTDGVTQARYGQAIMAPVGTGETAVPSDDARSWFDMNIMTQALAEPAAARAGVAQRGIGPHTPVPPSRVACRVSRAGRDRRPHGPRRTGGSVARPGLPRDRARFVRARFSEDGPARSLFHRQGSRTDVNHSDVRTRLLTLTRGLLYLVQEVLQEVRCCSAAARAAALQPSKVFCFLLSAGHPQQRGNANDAITLDRAEVSRAGLNRTVDFASVSNTW